MKSVKIKHVYPGNNTAFGFFSYYDHILQQEEARRIIVIKGGPGVGKSTFMRKIGDKMLENGYSIEHLHCSSDNKSLDGVVIPQKKVALIDGTAPHVVDPITPGAVDEIIHLGDYWIESEITKHKKQIIELNREIKRCFERAYRYISAAYIVLKDNEHIYNVAINKAKINEIITKVSNELFCETKIADSEGYERKMFASAITPEGYENYLESILTTKKIFVVKAVKGMESEKFLEEIKRYALMRGINVESYFCALDPYKIEHLVIPETDVSFTTYNGFHYAGVEPYKVINFYDYLNDDVINNNRDIIEYNYSIFEQLMNKGVENISKAKKIHDEMEKYYIENMNFKEIDNLFDLIYKRILKY